MSGSRCVGTEGGKEGDEFGVGSFGLGLVVGGIVGDSPAVRGVVDLALIQAAPLPQRFFQVLDGLGGHASIILGMAEVETGLDPGKLEMGAGRIIFLVQAAAMEGDCGGDAVGQSGRGVQGEGSGVAVADDAHGAGGGAVLIKSADPGLGIGGDGLGGERASKFLETAEGDGVGEVPGDVVEDRRRTEAVKGVGREDEVALVRDALRHLPAGLPEPADVREVDHTGEGRGGFGGDVRGEEKGVGFARGHKDADVLFGHGGSCVCVCFFGAFVRRDGDWMQWLQAAVPRLCAEYDQDL